jgi:uncharacterized phage protein (TIGR01671 family)
MREIKFRAWDGERMRFPNLIGRYEKNSYTKQYTCWGCGDSCFYTDSLMQYTGLKDKNGKEIYEGDIIRLHDCQNGFCNGEPLPTFQDVKVVWDDRDSRWSVTKNGFNMIAVNHWFCYEKEVIGDMHTTPELLEGE